METRLEHLQEKNEKATLRHQWVNYNKISIHIKQAVIAAEDAKFIDHEGFDWEGIEKAYEKMILFKKEHKSDLVIIQNNKIVKIKL